MHEFSGKRERCLFSLNTNFCFLPNLGEKSFVLETVKHAQESILAALRTVGARCVSNRRDAFEGEQLSPVIRGKLLQEESNLRGRGGGSEQRLEQSSGWVKMG